MENLFLTFVLAAYNEEKNIVPLLDSVTSAMNTINEKYSLLFVIEGTDNTLNNIKEYADTHPDVPLKWIYQEKPLGLTNAFKKGFENVPPETTHIVTMDVDLNHDPLELPRFIEKAKENFDIIIGSRSLSSSQIINVPTWKIAISKFANTVFNKAFKMKVMDKTSGYRVLKANVAKELSPHVRSGNFEGLMEFLLIADKMKKSMVEVPITLTYRKHGETKFSLVNVGWGYAKLLLRHIK